MRARVQATCRDTKSLRHDARTGQIRQGYYDSDKGCYYLAMSTIQADLFSTLAAAEEKPDDQTEAYVRAQLHALLALVKSAQTMPWPDILGAIHADNSFRHKMKYLPSQEAAALWAEFDVEMDRLYAVMNDGKDVDYGQPINP